MAINLRAIDTKDLLAMEGSLIGMPPLSNLVGQESRKIAIPKDGVFTSPSNPESHVIQGLDIALNLLDRVNKKKVLVYFDPDVDGLFAGKMLVDLLKLKGIKPKTYINQNRSHGFEMSLLPKLKGWTVLNGDFKITEDEVGQIVANGTNLISLDHHENGDHFIHVSDGVCEGMVINNMFADEPASDHFLSGAGVVYKLLEYARPDLFNTVEYRAMVAITLFSDVRDIEAPNAAYFLEALYGYNQDQGYLRDMALKANEKNSFINSFRPQALTREFISFSINPQLNALLRLGREQESLDYMLRNKGWENIGVSEAQKKQKELTLGLMEKAGIKEFSDFVLIVLKKAELTEEEAGLYDRFIGLLCSRMTDLYGKPVVGICVEDGRVKRGSFRGVQGGYAYREHIEARIGGICKVIGHDIAFGIVGLKVEDLKAFCSAVNKVCRECPPEDNPFVRVSAASLEEAKSDKENFEAIAIHNAYRLDKKPVGIKLTNPLYREVKKTAKFGRYEIEDLTVTSFDGSDPETGIFIPTLCGKELSWELVADVE